jgi:Flp pilus assembly protein protease CpaA
MLAMSFWDVQWPLVQWSVVIGGSLIAACTDLARRRIYNVLTFPMWISGIIFNGIYAGPLGALESFAASILIALPFVILFLFAQGGAGDAKLMAGIGAWLGLVNGLVVLTCVVVAGMVLAIGYAIAHRRLTEAGLNLAGMVQNVIVRVFSRSSLAGSLPRPDQNQMLKIFVGVCAAGLGVFIWPI